MEAETVFCIEKPRLHPNTWATDFLEASLVPKKDATIGITVMWAIWSNRKRFTHPEQKYQPKRSMEIILEIVGTLERPTTSHRPVVNGQQRWEAPMVGVVKMNVDGAVDTASAKGGTGVVFRNIDGGLLVSRCTSYQGVVDPITLEILACRDAILLAREKNYQHVIVETYCLNVVQLWKGRLKGKSKGFCIFQELQEELPFFSRISALLR